MCIWVRTDAESRVFQRRRRIGDLVRVFGRLHARTAYWEHLSCAERYRHIVRSLAVLHPTWIFCYMSAAVFHNISDSVRYMDTVHIRTVRESHVRDYAGVRHHYIADASFVVIDGVRVTSLERTAFDCMRGLPFPDGMAVAESVLRQDLIGRRRLGTSFAALPGWHRAKALRVLSYASGATENGGEAYALGVIVDHGYAVPSLQKEIVDPRDLARVYRVDFFWRTPDGRGIVGELDGRVKYRDSSMYRNDSLSETVIAEKEREEGIRLVVDELFRFSFAEALHDERLLAKLDRAGVPKAR